MQNDLSSRVNTFFGPIFTVSTDLRISKELDQLGHWEFHDFLNIIEIFQKYYADRRGAVLDIGSNIGTWTLPLSRRYPERNFYAFECQTILAQCLERTVQENQLNNVHVMNVAVSNNHDKISVPAIDYNCGANFGAYELVRPYANSDWNGQSLQTQVTVDQCTVDSLKIAPVDLIKLDIEGMEYQALQGAENTIAESKPMIVYENHKTNAQLANKLLTNLGYLRYNDIGQMSIFLHKQFL